MTVGTEEFSRHSGSEVSQFNNLAFCCDGDVGVVSKTLLDFGVVYLDELQLLL